MDVTNETGNAPDAATNESGDAPDAVRLPSAAELLATTRPEPAADAPAATSVRPGSDEELLPCGREPETVLEHAGAGLLDEHERSCPECQAVIRDHSVLDQVTREWAELPVPVPDDLGSRVMRLVRAELHTGRLLPLGEPDEQLTLTETAAARTLRAAADAEPGVQARSCRIRPHENRAGAAVPGPVTVRLSVGVPYGEPIHPLADRLRERVTRAATERLGLEVAKVDVDVVGLEPAARDRKADR
ncbi:Asp23/Gls24 family envelope stress response protein [Embleya sp. NBC_00896]|uniref:Asp23/Gls24 family envelope stress response protein n=1 Tax=Embleya sp. NBC_00896 TaxID=2975961 RepID=UPI003863BCC4|nr:Asp23/Gls24 family envelope stress response protein [Embleya sp. NBC_00896]